MISICFVSVLIDAPSFAEPGDALLDKVAKDEVTIPCPAEGMTWVSYDSAVNRQTRTVIDVQKRHFKVYNWRFNAESYAF